MYETSIVAIEMYIICFYLKTAKIRKVTYLKSVASSLKSRNKISLVVEVHEIEFVPLSSCRIFLTLGSPSWSPRQPVHHWDYATGWGCVSGEVTCHVAHTK